MKYSTWHKGETKKNSESPTGIAPLTSQTPGGCPTHWARRTHREQGHLLRRLTLKWTPTCAICTITQLLPFVVNYSLSCKTVNTRKYFWNVYCFTTNQMRDEAAKDNCPTAAGMPYLLREIFNFPFASHWKSLIFYHKPTLFTWFRLFKNQTTKLT